MPRDLLTFDLTISADEAMQRITSMMDVDKPFGFFRYIGEKAFIGKVSGNHFYILKKIQGHNSFRPRLSGTVVEVSNGCRIEVRVGSSPFVWGFVAFWFVGVFCMLMFGGMLTMSQASSDPVLMVMGVPVMMLIFGGLFTMIGANMAGRDKVKLETAFISLFNDCSRTHSDKSGKV